jgi:oxidoreductase
MFSRKSFGIAILVIVLAFYYYSPDPDSDFESSEVQVVKMSKRLSVFVLGATGEVGKEVVKELAKQSGIERVTLIGRRKVDLPASDDTSNYGKFSQTIVDFDKLATDHAAAFEGFDVGISTLGTTRGKAGKEGFYKVDHDYVVESARLAKAGGCKHLHLVTASSANKNSFIYYSQVKGQVEEEITQMGFERLSIYHPGLLLCDRTERRALESVSIGVARMLDRWRKMSVETSLVARAIINKCLQSSDQKVEILDNGQINALGKVKLQSQ